MVIYMWRRIINSRGIIINYGWGGMVAHHRISIR
jgi:hypothetical protein